MTPGLITMWISFAAIIMLFVAAGLIVLSRQKLKGIFRVLTATVAYVFMIVAGFIVVLIIFGGGSS